MKIKISKRGRISLPAPIRRRWAADALIIEDFIDRVVLRPVPADPTGEAMGSLPSEGRIAARDIAQLRREEQQAESRKGLGL